MQRIYAKSEAALCSRLHLAYPGEIGFAFHRAGYPSRERLQGLLGAGSYDQLMNCHKGWVEEYLGDGEKARAEEWTDSIAVGNRPFVEGVKELLGFRAKGRKVIEAGEPR